MRGEGAPVSIVTLTPNCRNVSVTFTPMVHVTMTEKIRVTVTFWHVCHCDTSNKMWCQRDIRCHPCQRDIGVTDVSVTQVVIGVSVTFGVSVTPTSQLVTLTPFGHKFL